MAGEFGPTGTLSGASIRKLDRPARGISNLLKVKSVTGIQQAALAQSRKFIQNGTQVTRAGRSGKGLSVKA